ncbi:uncharacterized protein Z520_01121 [Fonsecaea multimorphosa CBS 102226]|uniref:DUF218 domain-containing protein n=1 Tax=Fonsecaea multimorphosa CBS 102226 TaxID=1442371 RepID=A0A0D2HL56_9EURO|nr:uncharacterized protein Z520_01121 [Fonsecaea multimorphosa CBS 102226]KIY02656.1 hypothetical protein Z520_01121 [Fonsecaea multimorphosa CBS 102226]OAL31519.1 hypothetical protein AYO22_01111 [Fonsecaea multimorphosa]
MPLQPPVPSHLIVVCCHAIYQGGHAGPHSSASEDESNWLIEPFQAGETGTYISHVEAGVRELAKDREHAILVFSGAATKPDKTPLTEAEGYLNVAVEHDFFGLDTSPPTLRQRIFVDRYATDSYQNILCSLIQFPLFVQQLQSRESPQATIPSSSQRAPSITAAQDADENAKQDHQPIEGPFHFPTKLTIVSHAFKRARFLHLHLPALRFPPESTVYVGINPPFTPAKLAEIEEGDRLRGYGAWEKDLYGAGEGLSNKREKRGWGGGEKFRTEVLARFGDRSCRRELEGLLAWCGGVDGMTLWQGGVPWE